MNFFEHQDQARRNTTQLVALFFLAIAVMIVAVYLIIILTVRIVAVRLPWWQPSLFLLISLVMLSIIGFGSLTKMFELRRGGSVVANSLGGQQLNPQTNDAKEMQLLNVVAEMALASGTPIPTVYLLSREPGINAFAAGYTPDDAVIGVTRGCLEQLNRDELQGVIAHEFSHILNGDMRLNLNLIGVLQGLLFIHILGRMMARGGLEASFWDSDDDGSGAGFAILGILLATVGGVGLIAGRLIKSAVSRQREFLADASAVQFTRNPNGIAGALRRIGGLAARSTLRTPKAEEASHMFFGEAMTLNFMSDWFATHPPLKERIRRIAGVKVTAPPPSAAIPAPDALSEAMVMGFQGGARDAAPPSAPSIATTPTSAGEFLGSVGTASAQKLATAHTFLKSLPEEFKGAVRSPAGSMAIVYGLLLSADPEVRSRQLKLVKTAALPVDPQQVERFATLLKAMDPRQYLSLLDLAVPALRTITAVQCADFFKRIKALVRADGRLSVSEYVLQIILQKRLRPHFQKTTEQTKSVSSLDTVWNDCQTVLTILGRIGHKHPKDAFYAYKSGLARLPGAHQREIPQAPPQVKLYDLGQSLQRLEALTPKLKQSLVDAAAHTVLVDNDVKPLEAELLRAIVIALDCPIPPFLETVPKSAKVQTPIPKTR